MAVMPVAAMPVDVSAASVITARQPGGHVIAAADEPAMEQPPEGLVGLSVAPQAQQQPEAPRSLTFDLLWAEAAEFLGDEGEESEESSEETTSSAPPATPTRQLRSEPQVWSLISPFVSAVNTATSNAGDPSATPVGDGRVVAGDREGQSQEMSASPAAAAIELPDGVDAVRPTTTTAPGEVAFSLELQAKGTKLDAPAAEQTQPNFENKLAEPSSQPVKLANPPRQTTSESPSPEPILQKAQPTPSVAPAVRQAPVKIPENQQAQPPVAAEQGPTEAELSTTRPVVQPKQPAVQKTVAAAPVAKPPQPAIAASGPVETENPSAKFGSDAPRPTAEASRPADAPAPAVKPLEPANFTADDRGEEPRAAETPEILSSLDSGARSGRAPAQTAKPSPAPSAAPVQPITADSEPAGRIELQLRGENNSTANVLFADRGGQVQVTVRAPDPSVVHALRAELQQLSTGLEGHGYQVKMSTPSSAIASRDVDAGSADASTNMNEERSRDQQEGQRNPRHRNGQQPNWYEEFE